MAFGWSINGPTTVTECQLVSYTINTTNTNEDIWCVLGVGFVFTAAATDAHVYNVYLQNNNTVAIIEVRFYQSTTATLVFNGGSNCPGSPGPSIVVTVNQVTIGPLNCPSQSYGNTSITASIPPVANAAAYIWSATNGWIVQNNGSSATFTHSGCAGTTISVYVKLNGNCLTNSLSQIVTQNCNPVMIGPRDICALISETFYTYTLPAGLLATSWSVTSKLQIVSSTATQIKVVPISAQGAATITATLNPGNIYSYTQLSKSIWIGKPQVWVTDNPSGEFLVFTRNVNPSWQVCDWTLVRTITSSSTTYNLGNQATFHLKCSSSFDMNWTNHVVATNVCGTAVFDNSGVWPSCNYRLGEEENQNPVEDVTPNSSFIYPTGGNVYTLVVNLDNEKEIYDISIYDIRGLFISQITKNTAGKTGVNEFSFSMTDEAPGLYFCRIASAHEQKVIKFITE